MYSPVDSSFCGTFKGVLVFKESTELPLLLHANELEINLWTFLKDNNLNDKIKLINHFQVYSVFYLQAMNLDWKIIYL